MFVRDFNLVLVKEFCRAFSNALGANLHVELLYGEEPHHIAEADLQGPRPRARRGDPDRAPRGGPPAEHQGQPVAATR